MCDAYFAKKSLPNVVYNTCETLTPTTSSPEQAFQETASENSTPQECSSSELAYGALPTGTEITVQRPTPFLLEMGFYLAASLSFYVVCVPLAKKGERFVEKLLHLNKKQKPSPSEISSAVNIIAGYNNKRLTVTQAELLLQKLESFNQEEINQLLNGTKTNLN